MCEGNHLRANQQNTDMHQNIEGLCYKTNIPQNTALLGTLDYKIIYIFVG